MKRSAENQLTRDNSDADDCDNETTSEGFKKADEATLATRVIRGLPKRATQTFPSKTDETAATPSLPLPPPPSSFATKGGFTFKPDGPFGFASTGTPPATSNTVPSPFQSTSNTTNVNPSALSATSFSSSAPPKPVNSTSTPGLTASAFSFSTPPSSQPSVFTLPPAPPTSSFSFQSPSPSKPVPFTPTPPVAASASNTSKAFASFMATDTKSNNTLPTAPQPTASPTPSTTAADVDDSLLVKYYTNLRGLNLSLSANISQCVRKEPFLDLTEALERYKSLRQKIQQDFDDATSKESSKSPLSNPPPSSSQDKTTPKPSATAFTGFGTPPSNFSATETSGSTVPSFFSLKNPNPVFPLPKASSKPTEKPTSTATSSFTFGPQVATPPAAAPYQFGVSSITSPTKSLFGDSSTNSTSSLPATKNPFGGSAVPFAFGGAVSASSSSKTQTSTSQISTAAEESSVHSTEAENSERNTPAGEEDNESGNSKPGLSTVNPHDEEGVGEENEETLHAVKLKAYRMRKNDGKAGPGWVELGIGILRLKKDKDTDARRVLLRNSTNGKIILNFRIYSALKPALAKKAITFIGHDQGAPQTYCVRLPSEDQANLLKENLDREIEFVKAKETE